MRDLEKTAVQSPTSARLPSFPRNVGSFHAKLKTILTGVMTQGMSPQKLALSVAIGASVGVLPVVWGATIVCSLVAVHFRLNQLCVQVVNYLVYPLQLALLVPFYRMGAWIFPWGFAASGKMLTGGFGKNVAVILVATAKAIAAWLLTAPFAVAVLYFGLLPIFARMTATRQIAPAIRSN
jgi:hypothetical protein